MPWNDDSWRDTYDAWKLREPDYGDYPPWGQDDEDEQAKELRAEEIAAEQERPWNRFKRWWNGTRLVTWARARWWAWRHPRTEMDDAVDDTIPF